MRTATFNIWNSGSSSKRIPAICEEIKNKNIDLIALQEVKTTLNKNRLIKMLAKKTGYEYFYFKKYDNDEEGLAFLSRYPIVFRKAIWETESGKHLQCAINVIIRFDNIKVAFTNVHLSYESALERELQITSIINWITNFKKEDINEILLGDFNCYPESSIYRFLLGQQSLNNISTGLGWFDLAASYASYNKQNPLPTLDFYNNPRWGKGNENHMEIPARFDWILLKNCWPLPYPEIKEVKVFGVKPTPQTGLVPSDHYGVLTDLLF